MLNQGMYIFLLNLKLIINFSENSYKINALPSQNREKKINKHLLIRSKIQSMQIFIRNLNGLCVVISQLSAFLEKEGLVETLDFNLYVH